MDQYTGEAIEMLSRAGLDMNKHRDEGIKRQDFTQLFRHSSLIFNDKITWIAFNARFDYGYLLHLIDGMPLPLTETLFIEKCVSYLRGFYDVKMLRDDRSPLHK